MTNKQLQAARLKLAKKAYKENKDYRPNLAGAFIDKDKQIVCDGLFMVVYNDIDPTLPQADTSTAVFAYEKIIPENIETDYLPVTFDTDALLTSTDTAYTHLRFNGVTVSKEIFVNVIKSLVHPIVFACKTSTKIPLYVRADNGVALIMPTFCDYASKVADSTLIIGTTELIDGQAEKEWLERETEERVQREQERERRNKQYEQEQAEKRQVEKDKAQRQINEAIALVDEAINDSSDKVYSLLNTNITIFSDSKYADKEISIIEYFANKTGVTLPLKLVGWIRSKLHSVEFKGGKFFNYKFFRINGGRQSSTLENYLRQIFNNEKDKVDEELEIKKQAEMINKSKVDLIPKNLQRAIKFYAGSPKIKEYEVRYDDQVQYRNEIKRVADGFFKYKDELYKTVETYGRGSNILNVSIKWFDFETYKMESMLAGNPWSKQILIDKINEALAV